MGNLKVVTNPFDKESNWISAEIYSDITIGRLIEDIVPEDINYRIILNGVEVELSDVAFYILRSDDDLIISTSIEGIGAFFTAIAEAWAAFGAAIGFGATGTAAAGGAVATAGWMNFGAFLVMTGASMALSMALAPSAPSISARNSSSYSWNPTTTQQQGLPIPYVYGTIRSLAGNIINAYRNLDREDPLLNMLISYGRGPIHSISDVEVNGQLALVDDGIITDTRSGHINQTAMQGFKESILEESLGYQLSVDAGEYSYAIATGSIEISISITFQNGAYYTQNDGDVYARAGHFSIKLVNNTSGKTYVARSYNLAAQLEYQYFSSEGMLLAETLPCTQRAKRGTRLMEDTLIIYPYSDVYAHASITGTEKELLRDQKIAETGNPNIDWYEVTTATAYAQENFVSDVYFISRDKNPKDFIGHDITFRRLDENSTYSIYVERLDDWEAMDRTQSAASWSAVKYPTNSAFTYPRIALLGVQGAASSKYSGRMDVGATVKGRLIRVYNGSSWNVEYNNNPAWVCYDILTQPVIDNNYAIVRYDGIHPDSIDLNDFISWANNNKQQVPALGGGTEPLFEFNGVFDTDENIWDSASKVANNFRAALYYTGSKVRCTTYRNIDFTQLFSEGNIVKGSFNISYMPWEDRATEVEVTFLDKDNDYKSTTISILDKDINNSKAPLSIDAFGTTSLSQAWRFGKFVLNNNKYIQRVINFKVDVDALDCEIGDVIAFQHNIPEWGYGGRIDSIDNSSVYINHFIEDSVFKLFGFTQTEIDNFTDSSTVVNPSIDTVWVGIRDLQGNLQVVRLTALGPWNGHTRMDLETTLTTISPKDPYVISSSTFDQARTFRISSIEQDEDFIHTVEAIEYKKEVFTETDGVTPDIDESYIIRPKPFPHISNLRITDNVYLGTSNNKIRKIYVTWDIPEEFTYKGIHISYQPIDNEGNYGELVEVGDYFSRFCEFETNKTTRGFNIHLQTINNNNIVEPLSTSINELYFVESVLDIYPPEMQEGVKNLRVENSLDGVKFNEQNCSIIWDGPTGENFNSAFSQDFSRYDWVSADWLDSYIINIYEKDSGNLVSSHTTKIPYFNYTYELNIKDGLSRSFIVGVQAKDIDGNTGVEKTITPYNLQAGQVQGVSSSEVLEGTELWWNLLEESDVAGYNIHLSTSSDFTPDESTTLYGSVDKNTSSIMLYANPGNWYIKVCAFDVFSKDNVVYSDQLLVTINTSADVRNWQFSGEFSSIDNDTVGWSSGTLTLSSGDTYSISASNTSTMFAKSYIYYSVGETTFSKTYTASFSVGQNKILLAVAEPSLTEAKFTVFGGPGGTKITADEIAANSITANEIAAGTITAGEIASGAISTSKLDFTPLISSGDTSDIVGSINASSEGIRISSSKLSISGSTYFYSGYDPSTKETPSGAQAKADTAESNANTYTDNQISAMEASGSVVIRSATAPSTRPDESSLEIGDIWIETDDGDKPRLWDGTSFILMYTSINGGYIETGSITADKIESGSITTNELNFTPVESDSVISSINSSPEGIVISGDNLEINADTVINGTFTVADYKISDVESGADVTQTIVDEGLITTGSIELSGTTGYIKTHNFSTVAGDEAGWRIKSSGNAVFNDVTVRGILKESSVDGTVDINTGEITAGTTTIDSTGITGTGFSLTNTGLSLTEGDININSGVFSVSTAGELVASSATITGDITANSGSLSNLDISGELTVSSGGSLVAEGSTGNTVVLNQNGIVATSSTLGTTFSLPSDGSAPTFSSGEITSVSFNLYESNVITTSETADTDGGIIINDTGIKGYDSSGDLTVNINSTDGNFTFGDVGSNNFVSWDGTSLNVRGDLNADDISTGTIDASSISVENLNASNITTGSIDASEIAVTNLVADNVTSGTFTGLKFQTSANTSDDCILINDSTNQLECYTNGALVATLGRNGHLGSGDNIVLELTPGINGVGTKIHHRYYGLMINSDVVNGSRESLVINHRAASGFSYSAVDIEDYSASNSAAPAVKIKKYSGESVSPSVAGLNVEAPGVGTFTKSTSGLALWAYGKTKLQGQTTTTDMIVAENSQVNPGEWGLKGIQGGANPAPINDPQGGVCGISDTGYGVYGYSYSGNGAGFYGQDYGLVSRGGGSTGQWSIVGSDVVYTVYPTDITNSPGAAGLAGYASKAGGVGVYGLADNSTDISYGGYFTSSGTGGIGVRSSGAAYDFYAVGHSGGSSSYGPFTGGHDGVILRDVDYSQGDILIDLQILNKESISNTIALNTLSNKPKQKSVFGVFVSAYVPVSTATLLEEIKDEDGGVIERIYEKGTTEELIATINTCTTVEELVLVLESVNFPAALRNRYLNPLSGDEFLSQRDLLSSMLSTHKFCIMNAVGEGQINVVAEGGNIEAGDYICSSSTPGKGMRQDDDLLHNYTVAKSREDVTWTQEEIDNNVVKMVACTYHCG